MYVVPPLPWRTPNAPHAYCAAVHAGTSTLTLWLHSVTSHAPLCMMCSGAGITPPLSVLDHPTGPSEDASAPQSPGSEG